MRRVGPLMMIMTITHADNMLLIYSNFKGAVACVFVYVTPHNSVKMLMIYRISANELFQYTWFKAIQHIWKIINNFRMYHA